MQELQLNHAINSIRVRFGSQALTRGGLPPPQPWPSHTVLDRLAGIGGLPRGRLTLLTGSGTCGKLTLSLALLAAATHEFAHAVVVDMRGEFDPWSMLPFAPELNALSVVRLDQDAAGEAAVSLAKAGAGFLLLMGEVPEAWLGPLESGANRSGTVMVGVVDAPGRAFAHASSLSIGCSRADWVWERGQLVGMRTVVRCLKNRVAAPVGESEVEVRFPLGPQRFAESPLAEMAAVTEMECASAVV
jgi:RecA/RadA recombinase